MSLSWDFCKQSRAISNTWWCTKRTIATESDAISLSVEMVSLLSMKFCRRSSICFVALGNRSLYSVFIITISLSITGVRIGLDKERLRGRMVVEWAGDRLPWDPMLPSSTPIRLGFESLDEKWRWCWWCRSSSKMELLGFDVRVDGVEVVVVAAVVVMDDEEDELPGVPWWRWWWRWCWWWWWWWWCPWWCPWWWLWWAVLVTTVPVAPSWCNRSWEEHWDWKWMGRKHR